MKVHELKTVQPFFDNVKNGVKKFEIRKDDRGFLAGDYLHLKEWDNSKGVFVGNHLVVKIEYILDQYVGLQNGYVIMSISNPL